MKEIIKISMGMKMKDEKVDLTFQTQLNSINGAITEEVAEKIRIKTNEIAQIVSDAIEVDMNKHNEELNKEVSELEKLLDLLDDMEKIEQMKKETYEKASDKDKAKIDKFEEGLSKLDTVKEKLDFTIDALLKEFLDR